VIVLPIAPGIATAQDVSAANPPLTVCNLAIPSAAQQPPPGSPAVVFQIVPCFSKQGNVSMVDPETYLHYIQTRTSRPSQGVWIPYDESVRASVLEDFKRLWATGFLDDLTIEVTDYPFANGVVGKLVVYHMEERQRIKIVTYEGSSHLDQSKLDEKLRELDLAVRIDTFVDQTRIRRIKAVIAEMLGAMGYSSATVTPAIEPIPGGPKSARLTFTIEEGPRTRIRTIDFDGNAAFDDGTLAGAMRHNRTRRLLPVPHFGSTYNETGFEEDAERIVAFYRDRGFINARVGLPSLKTIEDSDDRKTRWVILHVPITEGRSYKVGTITVEGATSVRSEYLLSLFKLGSGDVYSEENIREGLNKARELYGALGRFEFTAYPDLSPREGAAAPEVDVTLRVQEGARYLINRITFVGNTTTRDQVIRRELRVYEGGVFNTEALKMSVRRLNQLGYFKPIEDQKNVKIDKTPDAADTVDLTLTLEEQNRNQVNFGAGMSELNGIFVNASFATTNFLGKGETLSVAVETGSRSNNFYASVTEPYVFDRPISLSASLFSRKTNYFLISSAPEYSEVREGASLTAGMALRGFSRLFGGYTYEIIDSKSSAILSTNGASDDAAGDDSPTLNGTSRTPPTFNYSIDEGRQVESRFEPTFVFDTVDSPFMPRRGMRITAGSRLAGGPLGGSVDYIRPEAEWIWYIPHTRRTAVGLRGQAGYLRPYGGTDSLPYYLRYFLGGENQIRGVDLRTVGPINEDNALIGGNKFVLFNAEYYLDIHSSVRALAFHDAGQAFHETRRMNLRELRSSSGVELRVVLPIVNMPFRLIQSWNVYRDAFQPKRSFRFAVGTTF
jgi:outer membrane protein insertion porin family